MTTTVLLTRQDVLKVEEIRNENDVLASDQVDNAGSNTNPCICCILNGRLFYNECWRSFLAFYTARLEVYQFPLTK